MKNKRIFELLFIIFIFLNILSIVMLKQIKNLDEIWNYNFARNVANGLIPYKDFNMLQMPLLPMICGVVLKLTTNSLIVMRIIAAITCTAILYIVYKIFNVLKIKKEISFICTLFIWCLLINVFCIDYNYLSLLIVLLIIYKEIINYKKDDNFIKFELKEDFILGLLAGLTITLKQTSGLFICVALLGNKLLFIRSKKELKIFLKCFIVRLIGIIIPITIILIYLIINNAFTEFINYTIKGISGFKNSIPYKNLFNNNVSAILAIVVPITILYSWYESVIKEKNKKLYIILVYGLAIFVISFPISDYIHFIIASIPTIILNIYIVYNFIKSLYKKNEKVKTIKIINLISNNCLITMSILILAFTANNIRMYINNREKYSNLKHYEYIIIDKEFENTVVNVQEYILNSENDVIILDAGAATYKIPIDKYNKNYDLFLKGNLGENGEKDLIQDIMKKEKTQYLILKDEYPKNWQTPLEVINYVKENKTKIGEIEIFDIYV